MSYNKYFKLLLAAIFCFGTTLSYSQIDIVENDTSICEGNSILLHANTNGRIPIPIPLTVDDVYSGIIPIGFPFTFYGNTYTQCVVSANGFITFDLFNAGNFSTWVLDDVADFVPGNVNCLNSIMAAYTDIDPSVAGGSIDYAVQGTAPFRRFIVSFCNSGLFSCNNLKSSFQIVLFETTNIIETHLISQPAGLCTQWNGGHGIQGVQNADGTLGTVVPGRNWSDAWTVYNESRRFTPVGTTNYTEALIPHLPIPDSSATITWYANGFQVGTGNTFNFTYTNTTTLVAMVTQCQDTLTDTITVTVNQIYNITDVDSTNPSQCEAADGTITLFGFFPGLTYEVHYTNTIGQPVTVNLTANSGGQLIITGLVEGPYTNFWVVSPEGCISNTWPLITLYDPSIFIDTVVGVFPTICEANDGVMQLQGLIPGVTYTVSYVYNGNTYTTVLTADGNGNVNVPGLTAGTYTTITASTPACVSNVAGPLTLLDPLPVIQSAAPTMPTLCRAKDGYITLTGLLPDSNYIVRYTLETVPFTVPVVATSTGDVIIPNLGAGIYDNITVQLLSCESESVGPVTLVNPPVTADFTFTLLPGCTEDTVMFTDASTGSAVPFEYTWIFGDSTTDTTQNPMHIYQDQGTYSVILAITDSVCIDSITQGIVIDHPLVARITVDQDTICQGSTVMFTDSSTATPPVTYYWDFGNGEVSTFSSPTYPSTYNRRGDHIATLVISDFIGCKDTAYKYIRVDSLTEIHMSFDSVICAGEKVTISATYEDTGSTGVTWTFADGINITNSDHSIDHTYEQPGNYEVHILATGRICPDVDSMKMLIVQPTPIINLGPDTAMCPTSEPLILTDYLNAGNTGASWQWTTGETTASIVVKQPGTYSTNVTIGECTATDSVWVQNDCYIDVPNVFTPNGDNLNDYFWPRQLLSRGVVSFKMTIYNRWGQEIFATTNLEGRGWDGNFNGQPQPQGVFVYVIDVIFKNGTREHKQGNVTLMR